MRNGHEEEYPVVDCDDDSNNISDDESNVTTADDNDNECDLQEFGEKQDGRSAVGTLLLNQSEVKETLATT